LDGLLRYRAALYQAGITSGFQWLDGSFVEDVESRQKRAPRDIDTVIFLSLPAEMAQAGHNASGIGTLFDRAYLKTHYLLDAYFFQLGNPLDAQTIRYIAYWYGFFSHRESKHWKGFVQTALSAQEDALAHQILEQRKAQL